MILRAMLFVSGIDRIEYIDKSGREGGSAPILLFVPHTTFFELYAGIFLPDIPCWVARDEAKNFPLFRHVLSLAGVIYVKRESESSRKNTIDVITKAASQNRIAICPEGTCGNGSALMRFKAGAFAPGLPVQPMLVKYSSSSRFNTTNWVSEGPPFWVITWLTLCSLWTRIEVHILPTYHPNEEEKQDAALFAQNVRKHVSRLSSIPTTPFVYDDVYFLKMAKNERIPRTAICIKLMKIAYKTAIGKNETKEKQKELTARTFAGTISEDSNLLFGGRHKEAHREKTLQMLKHISSELKNLIQSSAPLDSREEVEAMIVRSCQDQSLSPKSNAVQELLECLEGRDISTALYLTAGLCDVRKPFLWDRVQDCIDYLCRDSRSSLSQSAAGLLMWVLLGLRDEQQERLKKCRSEITFNFLRKNLKDIFPQAVNETIS